MKYYAVEFKKVGSDLLYRKAVEAESSEHAREIIAFDLRDVEEGYEIERLEEIDYSDYENFHRANVTRNVYQAD